MRAKVSDWRGLCLRTPAKWADFVAQSLHWKLPFPTQVRDWFDDWVVGSQFDIYCLHHPDFRNRDVKACKQKGRFRGHFRNFLYAVSGSLHEVVVLRDTFGAPVSEGKNPVPAGRFGGRWPGGIRVDKSKHTNALNALIAFPTISDLSRALIRIDRLGDSFTQCKGLATLHDCLFG